jgi:hypothetical protein
MAVTGHAAYPVAQRDLDALFVRFAAARTIGSG